jgi:hypothetical protein
MLQKQEKSINQMQIQVKQIKSITEKLESTIEGKKKSEWWEVYTFVKHIFMFIFNFILIFIYIAICGRWS